MKSEDQGDFETIIGYNRRRGDTCGPLLDNGQEVSFMYELCLPSMSELEVLERVLSKVLWRAPVGHPPTPTVTERR